MTTITIQISSDDEEYESGEEYGGGEHCPLATQDQVTNEENKQFAYEEADYRDPTETGEAATSDLCGNCGAYDQTPEMLQCIGDDSGELGYCQIFRFCCMAEHTCNRWVTGGPITELGSDEYKPLAEYEPREVF
jgi:hypothetical protein